MDIDAHGKRFTITKSAEYAVQVNFGIDRIFGLQYNGETVNFLDWMYGLADTMGKVYPVIERCDIKSGYRSIALPPEADVAGYLDSIKWDCRIFVGDNKERFDLSFKPQQEQVYGKCEYATNKTPSWPMKESFRLFSGADIDDLIYIEPRTYDLFLSMPARWPHKIVKVSTNWINDVSVKIGTNVLCPIEGKPRYYRFQDEDQKSKGDLARLLNMRDNNVHGSVQAGKKVLDRTCKD